MTTLHALLKSFALSGVALTSFATSAFAQDAPQAPTWNTGGIARINTQLGENGSCKQLLPNLIVNTKNKDWHLSGAMKIDNLQAADGCFGKHDMRLFFATATYKGRQDRGTTIKAGVLAPIRTHRIPAQQRFYHRNSRE